MAHIKLTQVRPGSKVIVRADIGTGGSVDATVTSVNADIKNGRSGIGYTNKTGESFWAYLDQITRVVKF